MISKKNLLSVWLTSPWKQVAQSDGEPDEIWPDCLFCWSCPHRRWSVPRPGGSGAVGGCGFKSNTNQRLYWRNHKPIDVLKPQWCPTSVLYGRYPACFSRANANQRNVSRTLTWEEVVGPSECWSGDSSETGRTSVLWTGARRPKIKRFCRIIETLISLYYTMKQIWSYNVRQITWTFYIIQKHLAQTQIYLRKCQIKTTLTNDIKK